VSLFRPTIDSLRAYAPGRQPAAGSRVIKLNTNENPYPPSPRAVEALRALDPDQLRRYPHPFGDEFRRAAASVVGVDPTWVLAGNGSDDLLTLLVRATAGPGRPVVYPTPTYVLYRALAAIQDAPVVEVPFDTDFALPVDRLAAAAGALTFVANPNSPSGTVASHERLSALATALDGVLVVDEAYAAFAEEDALALLETHPNMVILRTLSKSHALAGLRLGYAIAHPTLLEGLAKVKDSYNVGAVAACVGSAAILDTAHTATTVARIQRNRAQLTEALQRLGCRVWPSQANFVLVRPPHGDAARVHQELERQGILVRYFDEPALVEVLRITVGTRGEQQTLIAALDAILRPMDSA
jgi:histidinol-phosphate aminotransferase